MKRHLWFLFIIFLLLTGCWDLKDIDERTFVLGVAFDKEEMGDNYVMTIEIPVLANLNPEGGSSGGEKALVLSTTGTTVAQMNKSFELRHWRQLFFGHTRVIVLSEEVAREGIWHFIDFFDRNPHVDRRLKLVVAQGDAKEVLETLNPRDPIAALYLNRMLELKTLNARVVTQNYQDSLIRLERSGNTVLPRVRTTDTEFVVGGGAVIKDWKLVGWLGENETLAVQFLYDNIEGTNITVSVGDYIYSLFLVSGSTKIIPRLVDEKLHFDIKVKVEGNINEVYSRTEIPVPQMPIADIEAKVSKFINDTILHTVNKLKEFKVDPIGFHILTHRRYPDIWTSHQEDWDDKFFPSTVVNINTDVKIRRTGSLSR